MPLPSRWGLPLLDISLHLPMLVQLSRSLIMGVFFLSFAFSRRTRGALMILLSSVFDDDLGLLES